jgi:hypothetical protein
LVVKFVWRNSWHHTSRVHRSSRFLSSHRWIRKNKICRTI